MSEEIKEPNGKTCLRCGDPLTGRKLKFCDSHCKWWYHASNKPVKSGYSKNSQIRLDKACRRYANNFRLGRTTVRYN